MASSITFVHPPILYRPPTYYYTLRTYYYTLPPPRALRSVPICHLFRTGNFALNYRLSSSMHGPVSDDESDPIHECTFKFAVNLFNNGDYHRCHDYLEELWTEAEEPVRTVLHGILQCAVGFHHLFSQNHRGAMMELGEGLCKLRKMGFNREGPLFRFEKDVSEVLEFVYRTQKEIAACSGDLCVSMDGSERSYQLLGSFAAGQRLYCLDIGEDGISYIIFSNDKSIRVRVPTLTASQEDLKACEYPC